MPRDPNREPVKAVGLCSLLYDGNEGTDAERHVVFVDLDSKKCLLEPAAFRADLRRVGQRFGVKSWFLWETQKGVHVVAFELMSRRETEAVEEALEQWGGDGFHRFMGYVNGGTVLRVTPKRGEGFGPRFISVFPGGSRGATWSEPHWRFFADLAQEREGIELPRPAALVAVSGELRLEHYETTQAVRPETDAQSERPKGDYCVPRHEAPAMEHACANQVEAKGAP